MRFSQIQLSLICLAIAFPAIADDTRIRNTVTSVIEDSMCIPAIDGQGFVHADEDVANLVIVVIGGDGQTVALYDAAAEIEDVAAPGTGAYTAPSANNVRVSPQGNTGADCTEMQFADAVYANQTHITITVSDGQTTMMDYTRTVFINPPADIRQVLGNDLAEGGTGGQGIGYQ